MMRKVLPILFLLVLLAGCSTNPTGSEASRSVSVTCETATEVSSPVGQVFERDGLQVMVIGLTDNGATVLKGSNDHVVWCTISVEDLETMQRTWAGAEWHYVHIPPGKWYIEGLTPIEMMPAVIVYRKIS